MINIFVRDNFLFTKTPEAVNNEVNIHIYVVMYISFFVYNEAGGINLINEINKFRAGSKKVLKKNNLSSVFSLQCVTVKILSNN